MNAKDAKPTKAAAKKKAPSLIELSRQDAELKDFLKLVRENEWRDKAVALLNERIHSIK